MENFSQIIMDSDYTSVAYQGEANIGEILAPADINTKESHEKYESFAGMSSDLNDPPIIRGEIFDEPQPVTQPNSVDLHNVPVAIENNQNDAVDSTEMPEMESELKQTDVSDDGPTMEPTVSEEAIVKNADDKMNTDNGENGANEPPEMQDDSGSLIVPDEKTKRKDDIEEEINKNQCRICLSTDDLIDIFEFDDEKKLRICDLVMKLCTTLRINERDYLPHVVCTVCVDRLNKAFELKLQCESTDKDLRSKLPRRKRKARSATEVVLIDCNELSSGTDDDKDKDDDEFHLSEVLSSSSELDSELSSEEEITRPPPKRSRRPPPPKRKTAAPPVITSRTPILSNNRSARNGVVYIKAEKDKEVEKPTVQIRRVQQFICSLCKKTFKDRTLFNSHVQKHREEKERTCTQCKHTFGSTNDLQKHIKVHHNAQTRPKVAVNNSITPLKRRPEPEIPTTVGRDLFKSVAPLTTTYWSDSFSD